MYTNTSNFRVNGKYGLFTIPKGILKEQGWNQGDLVGFWGFDKKIICIQRICSGSEIEKFKKEGKNYDRKFFKKIVKFGGEHGTFGIKSLPEFFMKEFKPKSGQTIYFLPARYTWFKEQFQQQMLDKIIFAAFNSNYLKNLEISKQESKEELEEEYRRYFKENFNIHFFNNCLEISEKNSRKTRNRLKRQNALIHNSRVGGLTYLIEKMKGWEKEVQASEHPSRESIIKELNKRIREVKAEREELKKDKTSMFREISKEEAKDWAQYNIEEKRKRVNSIKRRYNEECIVPHN